MENITLKTLQKLIIALGGRFKVSISPHEVAIPFCPDWWEWLRVDGGTARWVFQKAALVDDGETKTAAVAWTAHSDGQFPRVEQDNTMTLTLTDGENCYGTEAANT